MCCIAGILFKHDKRPDLGLTTGQALTEMLQAQVHRGPDSAGWALYKKIHEGEIRLRFFISENGGSEEEILKIKKALAGQNAEIITGKNRDDFMETIS